MFPRSGGRLSPEAAERKRLRDKARYAANREKFSKYNLSYRLAHGQGEANRRYHTKLMPKPIPVLPVNNNILGPTIETWEEIAKQVIFRAALDALALRYPRQSGQYIRRWYHEDGSWSVPRAWIENERRELDAFLAGEGAEIADQIGVAWVIEDLRALPRRLEVGPAFRPRRDLRGFTPPPHPIRTTKKPAQRRIPRK